MHRGCLCAFHHANMFPRRRKHGFNKELYPGYNVHLSLMISFSCRRLLKARPIKYLFGYTCLTFGVQDDPAERGGGGNLKM